MKLAEKRINKTLKEIEKNEKKFLKEKGLKIKATDTIKTLRTIRKASLIAGFGLMIIAGFGGALIYNNAVQKIDNLATQNGFEKIENIKEFYRSDKNKENLDDFMVASENVSKQEYTAYLKAKKQAYSGEVMSYTSIGLGMFGTILLPLGVYIAEFAYIEKENKKYKKAIEEYYSKKENIEETKDNEEVVHTSTINLEK